MTARVHRHDLRDLAIWGYAFGYFLCYAPYSALTKALAQGAGSAPAISGFALLPVSTMASLVGMLVFLTAMGWWRHAGRRVVFGVSVPVPGRWTFLSGLCTAAIIGTTTLAYTFQGVSIVFMMLLMRGGVLVLAPIVDALARRRVAWTSWISLGLSLAALIVAFQGGSYELTLLATADVTIYLLAYFVRLRFMSRLAKSSERAASLRYFVEEQMVATPAIVATLALVALAGGGPLAADLRWGFTGFFRSGVVAEGLAIGILSQGTGVFGGLILLDRRENTFCVPVNRASSVLAGLVATAVLAALGAGRGLPASELAGAALIVGAIAALAAPSVSAFRRRRAEARRVDAAGGPCGAP